ncbi:MAG: hypothetical protein H7Z13_12105 [Ferruginibacter sp.]|nr:hypothetical protein [Ferruginibacter sp.]
MLRERQAPVLHWFKNQNKISSETLNDNKLIPEEPTKRDILGLTGRDHPVNEMAIFHPFNTLPATFYIWNKPVAAKYIRHHYTGIIRWGNKLSNLSKTKVHDAEIPRIKSKLDNRFLALWTKLDNMTQQKWGIGSTKTNLGCN